MAKNFDFESNLKDVEAILKELSNEDISLNDSFKKYKMASSLIEKLKDELDKTQIEVNKIMNIEDLK